MSNRTILQRRLPLLVAASIAGLGLAASPALAGSDGDQPPVIEQPPAPPTPAPLPLPAAPVPAPAPATPAPKSNTQGEQAQNTPTKKTTTHKPTRRTVALVSQTTGTTVTTIPTGAVQAGGGGTALAPATPLTAIGLAGGSFVLLLTSGGIAAVRRRGTSS